MTRTLYANRTTTNSGVIQGCAQQTQGLTSECLWLLRLRPDQVHTIAPPESAQRIRSL